MSDFLIQSIESGAADIFVGIIVVLIFAAIMVVLMFALLAIRAVWRWLTCASWKDVIVSVERRAFRRR